MKTLIVGLSVRAFAESAVRSGYPVIALDGFGDRDTRDLTEAYALPRDFHASYSPEALFLASRNLAFGQIAYTANLENHPDILQLFACRHELIGNSPGAIRSVRSWRGFFANLREAGFPVPETQAMNEAGGMNPNRRWLVKPVLSGGGHSVAFLPSEQPDPDRCLVQEFIPGKACSAAFVANGRECVVLGITEQLVGLPQLGARQFRYCGNLMPFPELLDGATGPAILSQVIRLAEYLTRIYGLTGLNGIDFIVDGDQVYTIEVNPRYSASMELIEQAYGLPMFHWHREASLYGNLPMFRLDSRIQGGPFFGKGILYADRNAVAPDTRHWHERGIRDIPASGERLDEGKPVCTILVARPGHAEVLTEIAIMAGRLRKEIHG